MNIKISVEYCDKCPHAKVSKVYTPDSFEDIREVHCKLLNKKVHHYLEWYDKAEIPAECPAKI